MAYTLAEVDGHISRLERFCEWSSSDLLGEAEAGRNLLEKAVKGDKQLLGHVFGGTCERIGRLRNVLDAVEFSDMHCGDVRWFDFKEMIETIEAVLKELGLYKPWQPPQVQPPAIRYKTCRSGCNPGDSVLMTPDIGGDEATAFSVEHALAVQTKLNAPSGTYDALPPSEAPPVVDVSGVDGQHVVTDLKVGVRIMEEYGWVFPPPSIDSDRERATDGFARFSTAVSRLSFALKSMPPDVAAESIENITSDLAQDWPNVVCFLASMRAQRRPYVSKIRFAVQTLSALALDFRTAVESSGVDFTEKRTSQQLSEDFVRCQLAVEQETCASCGADLAILAVRCIKCGAKTAVYADEFFTGHDTIDDSPLTASAEDERERLKWMWADAGILSHQLARKNAWRWSEYTEPLRLAAILEKRDSKCKRPVEVKSQRSKRAKNFKSLQEAAKWIRDGGTIE